MDPRNKTEHIPEMKDDFDCQVFGVSLEKYFYGEECDEMLSSYAHVSTVC